MKVKIYSYVGVIGGGKTYRANLQKQLCEESGVEYTMLDFSDPIREAVAKIYGCNTPTAESKEYALWKNCNFRTCVPDDEKPIIAISGRQILLNVGDLMKQWMGVDVFAQNMNRRIMGFVNEKRCDSVSEVCVIASSLRYELEAQYLIKAACYLRDEGHSVELNIVFCNYSNVSVEEAGQISEKTVNGSEDFAYKLLCRGCEDGENIAEFISMFIKKELI